MWKTLLLQDVIILLVQSSACARAHFEVTCKRKRCNDPNFMCISEGPQTLKILSDSIVSLDCTKNEVNDNLLGCVEATMVLQALYMNDCVFTTLINLENFVKIISNIDTLRMEYNSGEVLQMVLSFANAPTLRHIYISGIRTGGQFNIFFVGGMNSLYDLLITDHDFSEFPNRPFRNLRHLHILTLEKGPIKYMSEDMFYGLTRLEVLSLHSNKIAQPHNELFSKLSSLTFLTLSSNDIERLEEDLFRNNRKLAKLDISDNAKISNLPANLLRGLKSLHKFNSSFCSLNEIDPNFFSNILSQKAALRSFYPTKENALVKRRTKTNGTKFNATYLFPLRNDMIEINELDLSHNRLSEIRSNTFENLLSLDTIDLSYNPLKELPQRYPFGLSTRLKKIKLSNCELKEMPHIDWTKQGVKYLDLSYNKLVKVRVPIRSLKSAVVLLNNNSIETITLDTNGTSTSHLTYRIAGNTLACNCLLQDFLRFMHTNQRAKSMFPDSNTVMCSNSNNKAINVTPKELNCAVPNCPSGCECKELKWAEVEVNCSGKGLVLMPEVIPFMTTQAFLDHNKFTQLSLMKGDYWSSVVRMYLNSNSLKTLKGWPDLNKLEVLDLSENKLVELPSNLMQLVTASREFEVYLSGNEWQCNCIHFRVIEWMNQNVDKIKDYEKMHCSLEYNGTRSRELIQDTPIYAFCNETTALFSLTAELRISLALFFVVLFLLIILLIPYVYRHTILSLLYDIGFPILKETAASEKRVFDIFVLFIAADRKLVKKIVRKLEPKKRVCVYRRNKVPVEGTSAEIVFSIMNSQNTLLVLSHNFVQSTLFQRDFKMALKRVQHFYSRRIVLLNVDNIKKPTFLPRDLQQLWKVRYHVKGNEKFFAKKLKYFLRLPRDMRFIDENDMRKPKTKQKA